MITNNRSSSPQVFLSDVLVMFCAAVILVAFFILPWYQLEDGGTVTGYRIAADLDGNLDLATRASHMFLVILPVAAVAVGAVALYSLISGTHNPQFPGLTLVIGLMIAGYYYGAFFFEDRNLSADTFEFVESGFYVAFAAALGLMVQYAIPRAGVSLIPEFVPFKFPAFTDPKAGWRWPFAALGYLFGWIGSVFGWIRDQLKVWLARTPVLAFLVGLYAAAKLEEYAADPLAELLGFRRGRAPGLFGATKLLEPFSDLDFSGILAPFFPSPTDPTNEPIRRSWDAISALLSDFADAFVTQDPRNPGFFDVAWDVIIYDLLIYVIPIIIVALILKRLSNRIMLSLPAWGGLTLQMLVLYLAVDSWGALNDYRELVLMYMGINIMLSVSLNLVNGYMGEFSVGHAGFMAVGAYVSAILTMWLFVDDNRFGEAVLGNMPYAVELTGFLIALIAGGTVAALAGLLVAFPSFRTRGDYLAIVTLAVNFIVTGIINTQEWMGGPRGLNGVPLWATLPWIFVMTILSILAIYHLVSSTFGKGIIAIREDEIAAELMGINTKRVKVVAFLVSSFIAGVAGGLFGHMLAYVNPGSFGILKSTEALVMVYLGGMGSISGSIIAAIIFTILIEAFRPLAVLKWVVIPLILILLMLFRPQGLYGFREMNLTLGGFKDHEPPEPEPSENPKPVSDKEAADGAVGD